VFDTIPAYLEKFPATRISFLHLDMDVKEPTVFALEKLWERVVPDGVIVFDDYSAVAGETDAVDEFLRVHHLKLQKTTHYYVPSFIRKPV
jgi:predicted O-methyltransferase YrrM